MMSKNLANKFIEENEDILPKLDRKIELCYNIQHGIMLAYECHWNVFGNKDFLSIHKMFQEIYEKLQEHLDKVAERVIQLGGKIEFTPDKILEYSGIHVGISSAKNSSVEYVVDIAIVALATIDEICKDIISNESDEVTKSTIESLRADVEKLLWFARGSKK